jgi:hypothetical protein
MERIDLQVKGRGKLIARGHVQTGGVEIRLDDERNPAFRAEVWLPLPVLEELLRRCREEANRG